VTHFTGTCSGQGKLIGQNEKIWLMAAFGECCVYLPVLFHPLSLLMKSRELMSSPFHQFGHEPYLASCPLSGLPASLPAILSTIFLSHLVMRPHRGSFTTYPLEHMETIKLRELIYKRVMAETP
jgi:hypothetical protein